MGTRLPVIHVASFHVPRVTMPQIPPEVNRDFMEYLRTNGISHTSTYLSPSKLYPSQSEVDGERVIEVARAGIHGHIIVSKDRYIMDGHHRWYAASFLRERLKVLIVDLPHRKLIQIANQFKEVVHSE